MLKAINVENFPDGETVSLEALFGNTIEYNLTKNVTGARAMTQVLIVRELESIL